MIDDVEYLNETVWATLRPSPIHGIGVFAIRDIPKGTEVVPASDFRLLTLTPGELDMLHPSVRALILDRTVFNDWQSTFKVCSPNDEARLRSFMNHSDTPNCDGAVALYDIAEGEEITEDYRMCTIEGQFHPVSEQHYTFINERHSDNQPTA